ncbi:KamA family radical SAM protein [Myxococcus qinghaiensis]|uniref:KamA family radical SAM protein n=1 Tax=Myxococcus qinghaiensis TaxID=2906758 RepID=UPI0020A7568F|nr:lysine 2,3-aminomutase [Myxococcus qinghaiensis]MCP3169556.1 lysine 2,3-aminomutase [Myxococcus qinghaiensis]
MPEARNRVSATSNAVRPLSLGQRYRAYTHRNLDELTARARLSSDERLAVQAVAQVLPFRVNTYVVDELIDWSAAPDDPIYRLVFPQADMLPAADVARLVDLMRSGAPSLELAGVVRDIRASLNPHPAGQMQLNVPKLANEEPLPGLQHKYQETVLFFPKQGQTCHAYCTYCFRWAQFVGDADLKFASRDIAPMVDYVREHPEVTNVLFTGGDPMVMSEAVLARYIEPLLEIEHLEAIRIGTKALAYWPQRFVTDPDADDTLRLFEKVVASGKSLAFMAHFSHPNEMVPDIVQEAVRRIRSTGAIIRTQAPLIRTINDDAATWERMWRTHLRHGMVPYYMFVERDTGPQDYFAVPLASAYDIFRTAYRNVSGLARTVRGPSMSATPGKVCVDGVTEIAGEKVFMLHFIQAREPEWVGKPFFARYDEKATWLFDLKPALGATHFPWELPSNARTS